MRTFNIPAPPADLAAVKDWRGRVWTREDYSVNDDMFLHQFPDAENPARRSWWELINEGPLTECRPETFTVEEIRRYITPTHN